MNLLNSGASIIAWFPQEYAEEFFIVKGLFALVSTLMLLYHMNQMWNYMSHNMPRGQQLRYYSLLAFSVLTTGSTAEQLQEGALVNYRNLGALIVVILLIVAMAQSIKEQRTRGDDVEDHR